MSQGGFFNGLVLIKVKKGVNNDIYAMFWLFRCVKLCAGRIVKSMHINDEKSIF